MYKRQLEHGAISISTTETALNIYLSEKLRACLLYTSAAHAADAKHCHPGVVQLFHSLCTQQQLGAGILILHFVLLTFLRG